MAEAADKYGDKNATRQKNEKISTSLTIPVSRPAAIQRRIMEGHFRPPIEKRNFTEFLFGALSDIAAATMGFLPRTFGFSGVSACSETRDTVCRRGN